MRTIDFALSSRALRAPAKPGLAILVLASVLTVTTARAEQVGIVVTGEATLQPQLTSQLERWFHDRGRTIVPGALEPDAINTLIDCFVLEDLGCARGTVNARARSRSIIYARVEQLTNADGSREVSIDAFLFQKEHDAISERRTCSHCTDAKLLETVDDLMMALVHDLPPALPAAAAAPSAAPAPVAVTSSSERTSSQRLLPYGLMGAGGLALAGGIVMIALDEDPEPTGVQRPSYRDTATTGAIIAGVGAAAVGVGCYLWLSDRRSSTPIAAVSRDGGFVGWAGRF
jgi:hypothetical protein